MDREIVMLSEYVTGRTRRRLDGLTDDEYLWEPVPGCWSIRPGPDGSWIADGPPGPEPGPATTLAWRMWHLTECYAADRNAEWLGAARPSFGDLAPAPTADAAVAKLSRAAAWWSDLLSVLDDDGLRTRLGPPFPDATRFGFLLHMIDEQIHHGAEIGVLRDLYRDRA